MSEKDKLFDIVKEINANNLKLDDGGKFEKAIDKIVSSAPIQSPSYKAEITKLVQKSASNFSLPIIFILTHNS